MLSPLFAVGLVAQSKGPLLGLPHGFSIDLTTSLPATSAGRLRLTDAGIDGVLPPSRTPSPTIPDFSTFLGGAAVDVDAFSLGWDWIDSTPLGEAVVPPGQWAALTYTVSRATVGVPGKAIYDEALGGDAAADVFAYVIPGSALWATVIGVPFRSVDATEMAAFGGGPGNVDAHDVYAALIYQENPDIAALLPAPTVYFSVTDASKAAIPAAWTTSPAAVSGATVFATTWIPGSLSWTTPVVALTAVDLGIDPAEDLDALALDVAHGVLLFSTDLLLPPPGGVARNQLLFSVVFSGIHVPYRLPTGPELSDELGLGLGPDDIDGICALDPGGPGAPSPVLLDRMIGAVPQALPTSFPTLLQASAFRHQDPVTGNLLASTWMTGWPPPGTPQTSLAISGVAFGGPFSSYLILDVFVRPDPSNPWQGHPQHTDLVVPPTLSLSGAQMAYLWGALSLSSFDVSLPVVVTL
ncbi:MAG: hypothetical protein H6835_04600 [Planctomycetes bacterium]|nr:hypothetical protein [Planctomycetota bacterium]